ncbi:hypothetical protein D3C76_1872980 [compost metagenome]
MPTGRAITPLTAERGSIIPNISKRPAINTSIAVIIPDSANVLGTNLVLKSK